MRVDLIGEGMAAVTVAVLLLAAISGSWTVGLLAGVVTLLVVLFERR